MWDLTKTRDQTRVLCIGRWIPITGNLHLFIIYLYFLSFNILLVKLLLLLQKIFTLNDGTLTKLDIRFVCFGLELDIIPR